MTPKEKAIELHNKILNITFDDRDIPGEPTWVSTKCALIAVDEMINILKVFPEKDTTSKSVVNFSISRIMYLVQVKQELEKL